MAKAIEAFSGFDSFCRPVMVAVREDGQWFSRSYSYNRYGMAWSKWQVEQQLPRTRGGVEWGFKTLVKIDPSGLRLPN